MARKPPNKQTLNTLRRYGTGAQNKYSISGQEKSGGWKPKPITLPALKCLEKKDDGDADK